MNKETTTKIKLNIFHRLQLHSIKKLINDTKAEGGKGTIIGGGLPLFRKVRKALELEGYAVEEHDVVVYGDHIYYMEISW